MPNRAVTARERLRYFITFSCYGARLHGDESGSVDRHHNLVGSRMLEPDGERVLAERRAMLQYPCVLDEVARTVVLAAVQKHCVYRGWNLLAAHVRSNHVHLVVGAEAQPEKIMNEFKSYASRELNRLTRALQYVIDEQGEPMARFVAGGFEHSRPLWTAPSRSRLGIGASFVSTTASRIERRHPK